jgi:branched-subunit amino acid transport protein AzlD
VGIDHIQAAYMIFISGACTFFLRAVPFLLFGGRKRIPAFLTRLGEMLPPAIMAVLVIYCLKDTVNKPLFGSIPEFVSAAIVVLIHLWKRNTILSVLCGTFCYMLMIRLML